MLRRTVHRFFLISLLLFLVGCDHATKGVAKAALEAGGAHDLIQGLLSLRYVENTDIAFSLLRWIPETVRFPGLLVVGALTILFLGRFLIQVQGKVNLLFFSSLVLVLAGALGNYLDRAFRGYVVDFVHLHNWPVFNVADVYIVVGYVLLAGAFFLHRRGRLALERAPASSRVGSGL